VATPACRSNVEGWALSLNTAQIILVIN